MERRPAVGSKRDVGILHGCQVEDHHQERADNNIHCSPKAPGSMKTTRDFSILDMATKQQTTFYQ